VFDRIHGLFGRFIIEFGRFIRKINRYSSIGDGEFGGIRVMDFTVHILNADFYQILSNSDGFFQTDKIGGADRFLNTALSSSPSALQIIHRCCL
jgi:hypothetical protein